MDIKGKLACGINCTRKGRKRTNATISSIHIACVVTVIFPCLLSFFVPDGKSANKKNTKKRKLDDKAHYCCMSASQRAARYPGVMEARGDTMWCIHCEVPVQHSHPNFANTHIKSGKHQRKSNSPSKPDFGAAEGTPPSSDATIEEPVHTSASTSDRTVIIDAINEDVMAALLGAGIPLEKIDHPSFRGFLRKYTTVEGCIREASNLRKKANLQPLYDTHLAAIRRRLHRPRLKYVPHAWLSFDEWTIAAQGPALNNPGQHHMQMFTTADIPSTTVDDEPCPENHQKNKKKQKNQK